MKKVLFLGDSNTWGYDPRGYFQRYDLTYIDYLNDLVPGWIFFEDAVADANIIFGKSPLF